MDQQNNSQTIPPSLISEEQKQGFLEELGLSELPEERKQQLLNQMIDAVMARVMARVNNTLTDEDIDALDKLQQSDQTGLSVNQFILSRVPNFEGILKEEIDKFRAELSETITTVDAASES